jgi:hypothetical protein
LVRVNPDLPAIIIVHFPPQHVQEQAFHQNTTRPPFGPVPVNAMLSGGSRLVFELPKKLDGLDYSLQALMDWTNLEALLPTNALPNDANANGDQFDLPGLGQPTDIQTAIEFPSALILSPDVNGGWSHSVEPVTHDGQTELWHTRLGNFQTLLEGQRLFYEPGRLADQLAIHPHLRAVWYRDAIIPDDLKDPIQLPALAAKDRENIAKLSGDFRIYANVPFSIAQHGPEYVKQWLKAKKMPATYVPKAIVARRFMLTSAGAWADMEGNWDYPVDNGQDIYQPISLEQWKQISAGGRDNYVRVVERGFMCPTGNRAIFVSITERVFEPQQVRVDQTPAGNVPVFGSVAYLRQFKFIVILEPARLYATFESAFKYGRREMPFRKLTILTRVTPMLDPEKSEKVPFFPKVGQTEFKFKISAEDYDGNIVNFEMPLVFAPLEGLAAAPGKYSGSSPQLRSASINNQTVAFTHSSPERPGDGILKAQELTFVAQVVEDGREHFLPSNADPLFLPEIVSARVSIPAVERMLGSSTPVNISFDQGYLDNGFEPLANKGEVFAKLVGSMQLPFSNEKGGGIARPETTIDGISRALGPVSKKDSTKIGSVDTSAFDNVKLFGTISITSLLKSGQTFEKADFDITQMAEEQLVPWLDDVHHLLRLPVMVSHQLQNPPAIETSYLWKPEITNPISGILNVEDVFDTKGDLLLRARLLTMLDGSKSIMTIFGRLRNFALNFAGVLSLKVRSLSFTAEQGKKMDLTAEGVELVFSGPLEFVNTLKDILPENGFSDPPFLNVDTSGIIAGYSLGVPSVGVGIFSIQNIGLSAFLSLPFIDRPAGVRFAISERHKPFLVTVTLFGGGGFFALALNAHGLEQVEAAIEFGGNISINLGVASGGVYVMAGIYFSMTKSEVKLTGYLRVGGSLEVLGLISISIEFYLAFTYRDKKPGGEAWGQATVSVEVEVAFFSKSVSLTVEKRFAGAAGDPTFDQVMALNDWQDYVNAFA